MRERYTVAASIVAVAALYEIVEHPPLTRHRARYIDVVRREDRVEPCKILVTETLGVILDRGNHRVCHEITTHRDLNQLCNEHARFSSMICGGVRRLDVGHEVGDAAIGDRKRSVGAEQPCARAQHAELRQKHTQERAGKWGT